MSITVRPARPEDVAAMSRVLTASITELCVADHGGDPEKIASWTANKTPDGVAAMMAAEHCHMFVAELDGTLCAVGLTTGDGTIALNYVSPAARFRGVSKALLGAMEADLIARGFSTGRLEATKTALAFYRGQGWIADEQAASCGSPCRAMHKALAG